MSWRILCVCILAAAALALASCAPPPAVTSSQPTGAAAGTAVPQPEPSGTQEPADQPSSAGTAEEDQAAEPTELAPADPSTWETFTDETNGFSIAHPPYYVVQSAAEAELADVTPRPLAKFQFRDKRSGMADIDTPAFSIVIFEKKTAGSLQAWLTMNKLARQDEGWKMETYQGKSFAGVKVTAATFMAPGEFFYVAAGSRVYQLTPLGDEALAMLDTFAAPAR